MSKKEKLVLTNDDYTITKEMIETNEMNESLRPYQVVNRLLRYFMFEEHLTLEDTIKKIEKFLEDNKLYFTHDHITEICTNASNEKSFKPLKRLDPIKLYESDVQVINSLPNQDTKKTYLTMMVKCKTKRMLGAKEENINVLFEDFYQYTSYCNAHGTTKVKSNEILKYLQQNGLIDVPLFELDRMYYTAPQESGEVLYELDPTKLDGNGLLQQFYTIFGKGNQSSKKKEEEEYYMIIDLMKPFGREVKKGITEVRDYLIGEGVKKSTAKNTAIQNIVDHKKYTLQDFTIVKIDNHEDVEYLTKVEILQRSMLDCSRKIFTTVPGIYFGYMFSYAVLSQVKDVDMNWNGFLKHLKEMKKDGSKDVTVEVLKELKERK